MFCTKQNMIFFCMSRYNYARGWCILSKLVNENIPLFREVVLHHGLWRRSMLISCWCYLSNNSFGASLNLFSHCTLGQAMETTESSISNIHGLHQSLELFSNLLHSPAFFELVLHFCNYIKIRLLHLEKMPMNCCIAVVSKRMPTFSIIYLWSIYYIHMVLRISCSFSC